MKMYENIELITKDKHKDYGVASINDFKHAKTLNTSMITMNEFYESCKHYPIVFSKNEQEGWFALILLSLENNDNKFIDEDGNWKANTYIPAYVRRYPFIYIKNEDDLLLGFDSTHKISKDDAGDRYFFDEEGETTPFVSKVLTFMNQVQNLMKETKDFIETLVEMEILEESTITGKNADGKDISVNGFWILKEEKLDKLTKENKAKLCEKSYMQPITAHLISLSNIQNLSK